MADSILRYGFMAALAVLAGRAALAADGAHDFAAEGKAILAGAKDFLGGAENRYHGSPGNEAAVEKIKAIFAESGLPTGETRYETPVFVPGKTVLTVGDRKIPAHTLLPNSVDLCNLPSRKAGGRLYYVRRGELKDLAGKELDGALCLMDFDCGLNYMEVIRRGALGCIFIEPDHYSPEMAYDKVLSVPMTIPRYQVAREDGDFLIKAAGESGVQFHLRSEPNRWERRELSNLWVLVPGSEPELKEQTFILHANVDSLHYAPELSSGGQEGLNLHFLMKLFEKYRSKPASRSILFMVFNSSHYYSIGASEAIFHLFGPEEDIFAIGVGADSERNVLEVQRERSAFILEHYPELDPANLSQEVINHFRDRDDMVGGRTLKLIDPLVRRLQLERFYLQERSMQITRQGREAGELTAAAKDEREKNARRSTMLGKVVNLFNRLGQVTTYEDLKKSEELRGLLEKSRQSVIAEERAKLKRAEKGLAQLAEVRRMRTLLFKKRRIVPMAALGLEFNYDNLWMSLSMLGRGDGNTFMHPSHSKFAELNASLGENFRNRLGKHAIDLAPAFSLFWESGNQDSLYYSDPRVLTSPGFFYQRVPAFSFLTPYAQNAALLSGRDTAGRLDPSLVARKQSFVSRLISMVVNDRTISKYLVRTNARGELESLLAFPSGSSGEILTRVQDGSSIGEPETVLDSALVRLNPWLRSTPMEKKYQALQGGDFSSRLLLSDASGRAFYYNLPMGNHHFPESFGIDAGGRITHAIDKGETARKFDTNTLLAPQVKFKEHHMLAALRCEKADIYDLVHPRMRTPVALPKFLLAGGGLVKWFSYSGMHPVNKGVFGFAPVFFPAGERVKILFDGNVNLLNCNDRTRNSWQGVGFTAEELDRRSAVEIATRDVQFLNTHRIRTLEKNAVTNDLMSRLHDASQKYYDGGTESQSASVDELRAENHYLEAYRGLIKAYGAAYGAYPQVLSTISDMMKAVIFYLAVLVPFSFFLQRLLFNFKRVEAQIASFVGIFVIVYVVFHFVHPAFEIAKNPQIVLIAFTMIALAGFVSFAMKGKFDYHMESFKERFSKDEEVSVLKLAGTAMLIGVTNMKRRRLRTTLTCATIVLITFTMLSFTSISQSVSPTLVRKSVDSPYDGIFVSSHIWKSLGDEEVRVAGNVVGDGARVLLRAWEASAEGQLGGKVLLTDDQQRPLALSGVLALQMEEDGWLGPIPLAAGRYFSAPSAHEILVTDEFYRKSLGLDLEEGGASLPDDLYLMLDGIRLKVIGVLDSKRLSTYKDLRGASIIPQVKRISQGFSAGELHVAADEEVPEGTFRDVEPQFYAAIPFGLRTTYDLGVKSVSVRFDKAQSVWDRVMEFVLYSEQKLYFGATSRFIVYPGDEPVYEKAGRFYLGSGYSTSVGGLSSLIIPLLISATIIFNTMLGAVYERNKEIGIFNSIGLNPIHIALFFVAEAVVYGILGGVGGYVIGQVLATVINELNILQGINLNYSSLSVVYVILFSILIVVVSTLYPAFMAMRTASSSSGRRRPEKRGDTGLVVPFPFSFTREMAIAVNSYLKEYFDRHADSSMGDFVATPEVCTSDGDMDGDSLQMTLRYHVALAPYDLGVTQKVTLTTNFDARVGAFMVRGETERMSGQESNWMAANKPFLDGIRQYLLHWRILSREGQEAHRQEGMQIFGFMQPAES